MIRFFIIGVNNRSIIIHNTDSGTRRFLKTQPGRSLYKVLKMKEVK